MPVYSFITTITAPDREAAEAAASEIRVSAEEGIEAAIQDDEVPEGVEVEHTDLTVVDLPHSPVQATLDNLVTALAELGFGDDDEPVNGGDCVDVICEYWPRLAALASTWPQPPRFAELRTRIKVGTRILSVEGETSDTDHGERHTGEHAVGTITAIDDSQEHGICLAFEPSEVSVLLSLAELADEEKYQIDPDADDDCANGLHSWIGETGKLPPDTRCTRCGEPYGNPD